MKNSKKISRKKEERTTKVYFCPSCKGTGVGYVFSITNLFGVIPKMKCRKCGYSAMNFPMFIFTKKQLEKLNEKERKER